MPWVDGGRDGSHNRAQAATLVRISAIPEPEAPAGGTTDRGAWLALRRGASLADLMARMGHSSTRAALIYQDTAQEQDEQIANALSDHTVKERDRARNGHATRKKRST